MDLTWQKVPPLPGACDHEWRADGEHYTRCTKCGERWSPASVGIPTKLVQCKCGKSFGWVKTPRGKAMPANPDGTPHWATCTHAKDFKRARKKV